MSSSNTNHLHYGGTLSPGNYYGVGPKPAKSTTFKKQKRYEDIIRLENAMFPDKAIASMLGISMNRLTFIKKNPEYLAARVKITHGIILDHDSKLADIASHRRELLTQLLPPALQHIANTLQEPALTIADKKHKTAVALEVMDREGTFAKISRTEVKPVDHFDFEGPDAASRGVIAALKSQTQPADQSEDAKRTLIEEALRTSGAFQAGCTLTTEEQQKALTDLEENTTVAPEELAAMPVEAREQ